MRCGETLAPPSRADQILFAEAGPPRHCLHLSSHTGRSCPVLGGWGQNEGPPILSAAVNSDLARPRSGRVVTDPISICFACRYRALRASGS